MALFDMFNPTKRPIGGTPVLSEKEVRQRLLALNRSTSPWRVIDGSAEGVDYIAEWKINDAQWREIFSKARTGTVCSIYLKFNPSKTEVSAITHEYHVEWVAGVPDLTLVARALQSQKVSISSAAAYKFVEEIRPYEVYNYRFHAEEISKPLQDTVTSSGWTYQNQS